MTWDYRVVRITTEFDTVYQIHEVYYNKKGKPTMLTENGIALRSESAIGLALSLPSYLKALTLPVLDYETRKEVEPPISAQSIAAS